MTSPSYLIKIISQYGILEALISHLFPKDLLALALSSTSAYKAIFPRRESCPTLLKKMACNGNGILIRKQHHRRSDHTLDYHSAREYATCGRTGSGGSCESKPCHSCKLTTCDECRIHCVYQSIHIPAEEDDELPTSGGFVLLHSEEFAIMSPAQSGMDLVDCEAWDVPNQSYHDQGVLDLPVEFTTYFPPEPVDDIIDRMLGVTLAKHRGSGQDRPTHSKSPNISPFWEITERRQRQFCDWCLTDEQKVTRCKCTLRKQFLDRWLCLKCFLQEDEATKTYSRGLAMHDRSLACSCGKPWGSKGPRVMCLWCCGEVMPSTISPPPTP
ncbi:hypothetical protein P154DRAFT_447650 [Amniculicola lignicola CBS 123094]|uniref:Uncharacterized protein n=1 Tax=Amniculicola lignicola CBS 123094 TaxID=1392246 RepID=A0A6A5VZL8_9PLEO|nr:hypothetical protein P154DRAFT_447650 [Amniculicola lignicola CBS 123094]